MLTRELAINKVSAFARELTALGLNIKRVILFGSYAKNQQHEWSDIDVAVVADEFIGFGYEDRKFFSKINVKKDYIDIETKTFPPDYFEKGDPFIDGIKKTGVEIKI